MRLRSLELTAFTKEYGYEARLSTLGYTVHHGVRFEDRRETLSSELGDLLARARAIKRRSLRAVAGPAEISPAYLQKLERGDVRDPSPNVLYRLSAQLDLDYGELLRAAGYVVPGGKGADRALRGALVSHALSAEPLTKDEEAALTSYLGYLRSQKPHD